MPSEKKPLRFIIYTRCSTDDQARGNFTTLDAQAHHCQYMLKALGHECARIVKDDGYSGKDLKRPGIQSILKEIGIKDNPRTFDGIIFLRLDRLSRNPRDIYDLIEFFNKNDIVIRAVHDQCDTTNADGRAIIGFSAIIAQLEREKVGERVKASALARAQQGRWVGGSLPYGYQLINNGSKLSDGRQPHKIAIDKKTSPIVKMIFSMAADSSSLMGIGKELEKRGIKSPRGVAWRKQSILNVLRNPFYKGYIPFANEIHKSIEHQGIIDRNLWERANKLIGARLPKHRFTQKPKAYTFLLEGMLKCGKCGSRYIAIYSLGHKGNKFHYYYCGRAKQHLGCDAPSLPAVTFDQAILDYFRRSAKDKSIILKAIKTAVMEAKNKLSKTNKEINKVQKRLDKLKDDTDKMVDAVLKGKIPEGITYKSKMEAIEKEIEDLENRISRLQAQKHVAETAANSNNFIHSNFLFMMEKFDKVSLEAKKPFIQALIKDIIIFDDRIKINMFVGKPIESLLASDKPTSGKPTKRKRPIHKNGALTEKPEGLTFRPILLPEVDEVQTSVVELSIKLNKRRGRSYLFSLDTPLPEYPKPQPALRENIIAKALLFHKYLNEDPGRSYLHVSRHFRVSRARVSQLIGLVNRLPENFIKEIKDCKDQGLLQRFSGKRLLKIASFGSLQKRQVVIDKLFEKD